MTKFDELMDIITHNKNKSAKKNLADEKEDDDNDIELEVSGSYSNRFPIASFGDSETDPDIIEQLYRSPRNRIPRGEGASNWDSDY